WRSALSLCWQSGIDWPLAPQGSELLYQAWQKQMNCPQTTAVGRLFDAAAALIGQVQLATFEGQGPMWLEALGQQAVNHTVIPLPLSQNTAGLWETDWAPLLPYLLDTHLSLAERAASFHYSLAQAVVHQVLTLRQSWSFAQIGLCGGVFQNRLLTEAIIHALEHRGFTVFIPRQLPSNDASLSFGQIIESGWPSTP
ncbi:MAG: carbamoyltransferase HypF, partial [Pseudomonadota bacterium]|nr:carbamoyltransferase HypF [Pseudomonadota bacterium]